jgi:hypothetical protein
MDIGGIANVITALGTIGMLIFLAIQIRDNTRVMQASALGSMLQNARERTVGLLCDNAEVSDIVARGTDSLENLSEQERFRFLFFMTDMALHMQHVVELLDAKLISQTDHDGWLQWTSAVFRTHGATALWPQLVPVLRAPVRKLLQEHRDANPDAPTIFEIMPVFRQSRFSGASVVAATAN